MTQPKPDPIIEVTGEDGRTYRVDKVRDDDYDTLAEYVVLVDGVSKHGTCTAEDVIRALGNYINAV